MVPESPKAYIKNSCLIIIRTSRPFPFTSFLVISQLISPIYQPLKLPRCLFLQKPKFAIQCSTNRISSFMPYTLHRLISFQPDPTSQAPLSAGSDIPPCCMISLGSCPYQRPQGTSHVHYIDRASKNCRKGWKRRSLTSRALEYKYGLYWTTRPFLSKPHRSSFVTLHPSIPTF